MSKGKGEFMVGVNGNVNLHSWSLEATSVPKGERRAYRRGEERGLGRL